VDVCGMHQPHISCATLAAGKNPGEYRLAPGRHEIEAEDDSGIRATTWITVLRE